jgi:nucleoside-diphosphate-sugar epimerase
VRILVTGATGFVGNIIARRLLEAGHQVRALSRSTGHAMTVFAKSEPGRRGLADGSLTFAQADVTRKATLLPAVTAVDVIIHCTQFTGAPVEDPGRGLTYANIDFGGTLNLLEAIVEVYAKPTVGTAGPMMVRFPEGSPRLVYQSGITVDPLSPYTWDKAKWQAEEAIRSSGVQWTIVRCCPVYGPDDASFNRILHYSDYLPFVPTFGNGQGPLTPIFAEDVGRFYDLVVEDPERSRDTTFGLGGPDLVTFDQFIHLALRAMGRVRPILHIPKPVGKVQGAIAQFLPGRPLTPDAVDFVSQDGAASDDDRRRLAERFPAFTTTPLRQGLESYLTRHN